MSGWRDTPSSNRIVAAGVNPAPDVMLCQLLKATLINELLYDNADARIAKLVAFRSDYPG